VTVEPGSTAVVTLDLDAPAEPSGPPPGPEADEPPAEEPRVVASRAPGAGPPPAGRVEAPRGSDLALERRGLTTYGARALPRGRSTIAIGSGYPYLLDSRVLVGAMPRGAPFGLDAGVLFRTYGTRWELAATGRVTMIDQEPFALGAFVDAGGGSTYFDDSKRNYWFLNGGVAASLSALGAVTITGRAYLNAWTDRHCPGEANEGSPTDLCRQYRANALDRETKRRVDDLVGEGNMFDRDNGLRAIISLAVELAMSDRWNLWVLIEGAPRQEERAAFTDLFHGAMFEEDARTYLRGGLTYKF
jgi:hypothetical protein